jgi:hypothetical protein
MHIYGLLRLLLSIYHLIPQDQGGSLQNDQLRLSPEESLPGNGHMIGCMREKPQGPPGLDNACLISIYYQKGLDSTQNHHSPGRGGAYAANMLLVIPLRTVAKSTVQCLIQIL